MSESFVGEIKMIATTFSPRQWAFCSGSTFSISQNQVLFALIGAQYGGDGRSSFMLPDLRGRVPVHFGQGPGLQPYPIARQAGVEKVTLLPQQMPTTSTAIGNVLARSPATESTYISGAVTGESQQLNDAAVETVGANEPHTNMMPYLAIHFIICLNGLFPSRN
jgi:microcystin-dependent protein